MFNLFFRENNTTNVNIIGNNVLRSLLESVIIILENQDMKMININCYFWYYPAVLDLLILFSHYFKFIYLLDTFSHQFTLLNFNITCVNCKDYRGLQTHVKKLLQLVQDGHVNINTQFLDMPSIERQKYKTIIERYFDSYYDNKTT